jgi:hypothetical protein
LSSFATVRGHQADAGCQIAMGQGYAGGCRTPRGRSDAWYNTDVNALRLQFLHLFATAPENKWIAAF